MKTGAADTTRTITYNLRLGRVTVNEFMFARRPRIDVDVRELRSVPFKAGQQLYVKLSNFCVTNPNGKRHECNDYVTVLGFLHRSYVKNGVPCQDIEPISDPNIKLEAIEAVKAVIPKWSKFQIIVD